MVAPLGNNSSTLNIKPCPPSYILQNFTGRKWPVFVAVYVNCIAQLLVFFLNCGKKFAKWHVYFSVLVQEQTFLLCSLEIPLFSSCDLKCLNLFEFTLPQQKIKKKEKLQAKCDFIILRGINHKTRPFSNGVQLSANTENQIYSKLCIGSNIIYPSVITMRKSLCYHHRMTIFQNT